MHRAGLTAVRLWAHGDGGLTTLQTGPGQYDARVFRSLVPPLLCCSHHACMRI